jgi:septum formation inhibitor MinC
LVVYGGFRGNAAAGLSGDIPALFTAEGAVSLYLAAAGVKVKQWRP